MTAQPTDQPSADTQGEEPKKWSRAESYERMELICESIRLRKGEFVLQCRPFRWHLNLDVIPNAYEMFGPESIMQENGLEEVYRYTDDLLIVRKITAP